MLIWRGARSKRPGGARCSCGARLSKRGSPHARSSALPHPWPSRSSRSASEHAFPAQCWNSPERLCLAGPCQEGSPLASPGSACEHIRSHSRAVAIPRPKGRCGLQQGQGDTPGLPQRRRERTAAPPAFTCAGVTRSCGALGSPAVCV